MNFPVFLNRFYRKYLLLCFLSIVSLTCYCQIYRKLTIDDFKGKPNGSDYSAYTAWRVFYRFKPSRVVNKFDFLVTLNVVTEKSWMNRDKIKSEEYQQELLNHEQGHFAIGALMQKELKISLSEFTYTRNYKAEMDSIFSEMVRKYKKMEADYDIETNHMENKGEQRKWNAFFIKSSIYLK